MGRIVGILLGPGLVRWSTAVENDVSVHLETTACETRQSLSSPDLSRPWARATAAIASAVQCWSRFIVLSRRPAIRTRRRRRSGPVRLPRADGEPHRTRRELLGDRPFDRVVGVVGRREVQRVEPHRRLHLAANAKSIRNVFRRSALAVCSATSRRRSRDLRSLIAGPFVDDVAIGDRRRFFFTVTTSPPSVNSNSSSGVSNRMTRWSPPSSPAARSMARSRSSKS